MVITKSTNLLFDELLWANNSIVRCHGNGGSDAPLGGAARCPCLISVAVIRSATEDALEKVVCCDELGVWKQRTKTDFVVKMRR